MRLLCLTLLLACAAGTSFAQQVPQQAPQRGGVTITRDEYVQRAADRAAARAGRVFDAMDTNHTGVITRVQARTWRHAHGRHRPRGEAPPSNQ